MHEILLTTSPAVLEGRIAADVLFPDDPDRDQAARRWRRERMHQVRQLQDVAAHAHRVDTTEMAPVEVAALVASSLVADSAAP